MREPALARVFVLRVLVLALLATLLARLAFLQLVEGPSYAAAASANRVRDVVTTAPRGAVYDAEGNALLTERTALVVTVDPVALRDQRDHGKDVLARLAPVVGLSVAQITARTTPCGTTRPDGTVARGTDGCWAGSPYQPVPVLTVDPGDTGTLQRVLVLQEQAERFPGVAAAFQPVRSRPQGTLAAHVLGYLGPISQDEVGTARYRGVQGTALVGRGGVEETYEGQLRGTDGVQELLVDKDGSVTGTGRTRQAVPGSSLVLSIDAKVQALAEQQLQSAITAARQRPYYRGGMTKADSGSVVVMEAKTGRVLALASYPSYDPSVFDGGISTADYQALLDPAKGSPLLFRAIQSGYAPASTFKAITTSAVVENGQSTFSQTSDCPSTFGPTGQNNFEASDLGRLSLRTAIVRSCDTNFYKFAYDEWLRDGGLHPVAQPKDPIITMALDFGLGKPTGVDLPSESAGLIPTRQWRQDYWEKTKADLCAGAADPAFSAERRAIDRDGCVDGYRFRGGQATNFAIGQGETLVTPLQEAVAYAAVANGGDVVQPTVAEAVVAPDGQVRQIAPVVRSHVPVRPETLAQLRDALHGVTSEAGGTAAGVFAGLPLQVGGKTGTGQVNGKQDTSWFASFAPVDDPQVVVVANISQGGTGATTAAPLVRAIYAGLYGLDGQPAALPGGHLPSGLPTLPAPGASLASAPAPAPGSALAGASALPAAEPVLTRGRSAR